MPLLNLSLPLPRWTLTFALLNLLFLLAGSFVLVLCLLWRGLMDRPLPGDVNGLDGHLWMRLAVAETPWILSAGIAFAASAFLSVLVALWTIFTKPSKDSAKTRPVVLYLGCMFIVGLGTISLGTFIWFLTLRERALFRPLYSSLPTPLLASIQNTFSCCGWSGLDSLVVQTGFCADPTAALATVVDPNVGIGCAVPFVKKMDQVLNNIFTTIYGFMAIEVCLLLAAATIAQLRQQERRLLAIDYKSLGSKRGFV